jgi:hypothetical protein
MMHIAPSMKTAQLVSSLYEAYTEAAKPGWYAGDGEPVRAETFAEAARFLELLPEHLPPSDVYAEPDGDLAFEWYFSRDRMLIVSLDGNKRAIYVLRLPAKVQTTGSPDPERAAGQVPFSDQMPEIILIYLQRLE